MGVTDAQAQLYTSIINIAASLVPALVAIGRNDVAADLEGVLGRADSQYRSVIATADTRLGAEGQKPPR